MSDVEVTRSYDVRPSWFQIKGKEKYEKRNAQGGLVEGGHFRWCLKEAMNMDTKKDIFRYEIATQDDLDIPYEKKGRKKGENHELAIGNEEFVLMYRSKEENDREHEWIQKRGANSAVAAASELRDSRGTAEHRFETSVGPMPQGMKFRPSKSGR